MNYYVIMHNMIVENEGEGVDKGLEFEHIDPTQLPEKNLITFQDYIQMHQRIRHQVTHKQLQNDLVKHLWTLKGEN